jgi:hypothetical protein
MSQNALCASLALVLFVMPHAVAGERSTSEKSASVSPGTYAAAKAADKSTGPRLDLDAYVLSSAFDRGKQLSRQSAKSLVAVSVPLSGSLRIGAHLSQLEPLGDDRKAFKSKLEHVGFVTGSAPAFDWMGNVTRVKYAGKDATTELIGEVTFKTAFKPTLGAYTDLDSDDWGAEFSAGPSWKTGSWKTGLRGRVGMAEFGNGKDRVYGGVSAIATRPLTGAAKLKVFASYDTADTNTFAETVKGAKIVEKGRSGVMLGIGLSFAIPAK